MSGTTTDLGSQPVVTTVDLPDTKIPALNTAGAAVIVEGQTLIDAASVAAVPVIQNGTVTASAPGTPPDLTFDTTNPAKPIFSGSVPQGAPGATGVTPQISATATGLSAGSPPTVAVTGTAEAPQIAFGLPAGATGATPAISTAAVSLAGGAPPTATVTGTSAAPTITFGIPQGAQGIPGSPVVQSILSMQGGWDASANSPTLTSSVGTANYAYFVTTAGTTALNGISSWAVNDVVAFVGGAWIKLTGYAAAAAVANLTVTGALSGSWGAFTAGVYPWSVRDSTGYIAGYADHLGAFWLQTLNVNSLAAVAFSVTGALSGKSLNLTDGSKIQSGATPWGLRDPAGFLSAYADYTGAITIANLKVTGTFTEPASPTSNFVTDATTKFYINKGYVEAHIIGADGQSNDVGGTTTATGINADGTYSGTAFPGSVAKYPTQAWMISPYSRFLINQGAYSLLPLVETFDDNFYESHLSSAINHSISQLIAAGLPQSEIPQFIGLNWAVGGTAIFDLGPGNLSWNKLTQGLQQIAIQSKSQLWTPTLKSFRYVGNEAQVGIGPPAYDWFDEGAYARSLIRRRQMVSRVAREILGQKEEPYMFISPQGVPFGGSSGYTPFDQPMVKAYHMAAALDPYIIVVDPLYSFERDFTTATGTTQGLHQSSVGQNRSGIQIGNCYLDALQNNIAGPIGLTPIPDSVRWVDSQHFYVRFQVPRGGVPVIDRSETYIAVNANSTTGATAISGYSGFLFSDGGANVDTFATVEANASIVSAVPSVQGTSGSGRDILFGLRNPIAAPVGACRLSYAVSRGTGTTSDGPLKGARGLLRGSIGTPSIYEVDTNGNSTFTAYPWAPPFSNFNLGRP